MFQPRYFDRAVRTVKEYHEKIDYIRRWNLEVFCSQCLLLSGTTDFRVSELRRLYRDILLNKEVIAVDQDAMGKQGHRVFEQGRMEVGAKPLVDGTTAVALFNRGEKEQKVNFRWEELHLKNVRSVRDLWHKIDLGNLAEGYEVTLPVHGAVLLKVTAE